MPISTSVESSETMVHSSDDLLHDDFFNLFNRNSDAVALITENGKEYTYGEVQKLVGHFSHYIHSVLGTTPSSNFIGLLCDVNEYSIAALLAILVGGYTYVPLDQQAPQRIYEDIIQNTKMSFLFVDPKYYERHKEYINSLSIPFMILSTDNQYRDKKSLNDAFKCDSVVKTADVKSNDLAYVLHTSGSTGTPKGIMLTHSNARAFTNWMQQHFQLDPQDIVMSRAPLKFDLSVFDIFNTFKVGARLVLFDWSKTRDAPHRHKDYVDLMVKTKATILYTTPSTLVALMNHGDLSRITKTLKKVMYAGEPFPVAQLRRFMQSMPALFVSNIYGPTETNIITFFDILKVPDENAIIPLGATIDDNETEIIIVNQDGSRLVEENEVGELWCHGPTVTKGYLGMPEKTSACLVKSPFHKSPTYFWKTGDLGYRDAKGILYYRGRNDHMVKISGYRIELGEVESIIAGYEGIDEVVVMTKGDDLNMQLVACCTLMPAGSPATLKSYIDKHLSKHMRPTDIHIITEMPRTTSGKADRVELMRKYANS